MLNLRGRSKAKKNSAEDERQIRHSAVNEAEMDTLGRNTKHAEKEMEMRKSRAERPQSQDGGKNRAADVTHQHGFLFLSGRRGSVEDQEEETDVDMIPLSRQEKTVRWTDVCQSIDGEMMEKVKMEERIKHQLFSGVCWNTGDKTTPGTRPFHTVPGPCGGSTNSSWFYGSSNGFIFSQWNRSVLQKEKSVWRVFKKICILNFYSTNCSKDVCLFRMWVCFVFCWCGSDDDCREQLQESLQFKPYAVCVTWFIFCCISRTNCSRSSFVCSPSQQIICISLQTSVFLHLLTNNKHS